MTSKKSNIKVSILCSTYNHKAYIRQALDSMLMQKTNFTFEILINDDASTDGTTQIIKEYAQKHPGIVKPVFHKENQYQKGVRGMMVRFLLPLVKGEYIALCEGDDYWTDSNKLQKQVDFLEKNKDYALCFHPVKVKFEKDEREDVIFPQSRSDFTTKRLLESNFIQTNSVIYRRQNYKKIAQGIMPGDWYLHLYHAQFGKIGFINKTMSVYRRHAGGVWHDSHANRYAFWEKYGEAHLTLCNELLKIYGSKESLREIVYKRVANFINDIARSSKGEETSLLERIVKGYPEFSASTILHNVHVEKSQREENNKLRQMIKEKNAEIDKLAGEISDKNAQIVEIKSSKVWKTRNKVAKAVGKKAI